MDHPTIDDHRREKHALIAKMLEQPWRDWTREGERVVVLHEVITAELTRRPSQAPTQVHSPAQA